MVPAGKKFLPAGVLTCSIAMLPSSNAVLLQYLDIQPHPMSVTTQMSLWDAVQRLVNAFKDVAGGLKVCHR